MGLRRVCCGLQKGEEFSAELCTCIIINRINLSASIMDDRQRSRYRVVCAAAAAVSRAAQAARRELNI